MENISFQRKCLKDYGRIDSFELSLKDFVPRVELLDHRLKVNKVRNNVTVFKQRKKAAVNIVHCPQMEGKLISLLTLDCLLILVYNSIMLEILWVV